MILIINVDIFGFKLNFFDINNHLEIHISYYMKRKKWVQLSINKSIYVVWHGKQYFTKLVKFEYLNQFCKSIIEKIISSSLTKMTQFSIALSIYININSHIFHINKIYSCDL